MFINYKMKEKVVKILTNKWLHGAVSFILTLLILLQEVLLSNPITVWYGMIFSVVFGAFVEGIRAIAQGPKYKVLNVLPWLIGGFLACLVMALI